MEEACSPMTERCVGGWMGVICCLGGAKAVPWGVRVRVTRRDFSGCVRLLWLAIVIL